MSRRPSTDRGESGQDVEAPPPRPAALEIEGPEHQEGGEQRPEEQAEGETPSTTRRAARFVPKRFGIGGRFFRGTKGNAGEEGEPLSAKAEDSADPKRPQDDEEGQGGSKIGEKMTTVKPTEPVKVSTADERELFMQFRHSLITGTRTETRAQMEVRKKHKHHDEDLGLLYEDRPKIFADVENTMQQRLALIEEMSTSNVVAVKGGKRAQLNVPKVEGREALPAIGEEGEAPEAATAAAPPADGAAEVGEKDHAEEEGGGDEGAAKRKQKERKDRNDAEAAGDRGLHQKAKPARKFLDSCGIMVSLADPVKRYRERSSRRFDPDAPYLEHRVIIPSVEPVRHAEEEAQYTLDVEVSHLEFSADPTMAREEYLMAQLMAVMRDFKRREMVGLAHFYAAKLGALEETLLVAREEMFEVMQRLEDGEVGRETPQEIASLLENCAKFELQVAETRQLKEEEELRMAEGAESMAKIFLKIEALRAEQGYRLTSQRLEMQIMPYNPDDIELQTQKTRDELDVDLLVAEGEDISGLASAPAAFDNVQPIYGGFRLRRVESTCASHIKEVQQLREEEQNLLERESVPPDSEEVQDIRRRLKELGPAPRRVPLSDSEVKKALKRARRSVRDGEYGVPRIGRPIPALVEDEIREEEEALLPQQERNRRQRVMRSGYYVKLLMNGSYLAGKSEVRALRDDFTLDFYDVFRVKLRRWPEVANLQLWRKGAVRDTYVSDIPFNVPGATLGSAPEDSTPVQYTFSSLTPFSPKWPPPGPEERAMSPIKIVIPDSNIFPSGSLWVRCKWMSEEELDMEQGGGDAAMMAYTNPLAAANVAQAPAKPLMPPMPHSFGLRGDLALGRGAASGVGKVSKARLTEWLGRAGLDPNDPRNAWYVELLKTREAQAAAAGRQIAGYFRLDVAEEVLLQGTEGFDARAKFLNSRWEMGSGFESAIAPREYKINDSEGYRERGRPSKQAPLESDLLMDEAMSLIADLKIYADAEDKREARQEALVRMFGRSDISGQDSTSKKLALREKAIKAFQLNIRSRKTTRTKAASLIRKIKTEDVVRDIMLPEFSFDASFIFAAFAPVRRFGPPQRKAGPIENHPKTIHILVDVYKASNLPHRTNTRGDGGDTRGVGRGSALLDEGRTGARGFSSRSRLRGDDDEDGNLQGGQTGRQGGILGRSINAEEEKVKLSPFVEVSFQRQEEKKTASVSCSAGTATWNDQLVLSYNLKGNADFTPSALAESRDEIVVSVYDKVIEGGVPKLEKKRRDPGNFCFHSTKRLLGTLRISAGAVYHAMEISGSFELEVPAVLPGYTPHVSSTDKKPKLPSIELSISFSPRLKTQPKIPEEELRSSEADDITRHAYTWMKELRDLKCCKRRFLRAMAVGPAGKASLICRYMGASWELPEGYDQGHREEKMRRMARLVSLVPYVQDNDLRKDRHDVWTNCSKSLELGIGDEEEHAFLLAGYFRYLGVPCWAVLGTSLGAAEAVWLLTISGGASHGYLGDNLDPALLQLWDPTTGRSWAVLDPACQLQEVGAVFDNTNIWGNIQAAGDPATLKWDLTNAKLWKPFFGPGLEYRSVKTLQQEIGRKTHYRKDLGLGKAFYDGLASKSEKCAWNALEDLRKKLKLPTRRQNRWSSDLRQEFFRSRDREEELERFYEAAGETRASGQQAELWEKLNSDHNAAIQPKLRRRSAIEDYNGLLFCLPMSDDFKKRLEVLIDHSGMAKLPDEWNFAVATHVVQKRVPYVCAIYVFIAAIKDVD